MRDVPWVRSKSAYSRFSRDLAGLLGSLDPPLRLKGSQFRVSSMTEAQRISWIGEQIRFERVKPVKLLQWPRSGVLSG